MRECEIELTEAQSNHRQALESQVITHDIRSSIVGQGMAFALVMGDLGGAVYLGVHGHDWLAGTMITAGIGAITAAFLKTASDRRKERTDKMKLLTSQPSDDSE